MSARPLKKSKTTTGEASATCFLPNLSRKGKDTGTLFCHCPARDRDLVLKNTQKQPKITLHTGIISCVKKSLDIYTTFRVFVKLIKLIALIYYNSYNVFIKI